jgi:uncharacterized protein YkwD
MRNSVDAFGFLVFILLAVVAYFLVGSYIFLPNLPPIQQLARAQQPQKTAPSQQASQSPVLLPHQLASGDTGTDVRLLQLLLISEGVFPKNQSITGIFGPITKNALLEFQRTNNLEQTGYADLATRLLLDSFYAWKGREYYLSEVARATEYVFTLPSTTNINVSPEWGKAYRVEGTDYTWTIRVGEDPQMATAREIFDALNAYRETKGVHKLAWDDTLAAYALERAMDYDRNQSTDDHRGFKDFLENENGFERLGFRALGENGAWGFKLNGTHIIEWVFAGDPDHDANQLASKWTDVGVGVSGRGVNLIFAHSRL